jgi:hypothetical protein
MRVMMTMLVMIGVEGEKKEEVHDDLGHDEHDDDGSDEILALRGSKPSHPLAGDIITADSSVPNLATATMRVMMTMLVMIGVEREKKEEVHDDLGHDEHDDDGSDEILALRGSKPSHPLASAIITADSIVPDLATGAMKISIIMITIVMMLIRGLMTMMMTTVMLSMTSWP